MIYNLLFIDELSAIIQILLKPADIKSLSTWRSKLVFKLPPSLIHYWSYFEPDQRCVTLLQLECTHSNWILNNHCTKKEYFLKKHDFSRNTLQRNDLLNLIIFLVYLLWFYFQSYCLISLVGYSNVPNWHWNRLSTRKITPSKPDGDDKFLRRWESVL